MTRDKGAEMVMVMENGASQAECHRDELRTTRAMQTRVVEQSNNIKTYRVSGTRVGFY